MHLYVLIGSITLTMVVVLHDNGDDNFVMLLCGNDDEMEKNESDDGHKPYGVSDPGLVLASSFINSHAH
ncbi:hypothetical protein MRB53_007803 [Persea americana]|uniref:Uncharacterized protein n=1 Tax=Persea americana TaxID=3435 RepID=A0ACC2MKY7_PERAE|nr:hypothetical protein MRB53_007803 [Persea americana]